MDQDHGRLPGEITGPVSTRRHAKYARRLPEYCPVFATTDRAIKRWIRRGKELRDLPPLDDPPAMAAWWRRSMDHVVPDKLLALAGPGQPPPGTAAAACSQTEPPPPERDFSQVKSLDITENVAALRQTHAINKHLLDEALRENNETAITLRQRNYERTMKLLRDAELTLLEIQRQRGSLIDAEDVRAELSQVLESLHTMRETMTERIFAELEKMLPRRLARVFRTIKIHLAPAIERVRQHEDGIFRSLDSISGPEVLRDRLAA